MRRKGIEREEELDRGRQTGRDGGRRSREKEGREKGRGRKE